MRRGLCLVACAWASVAAGCGVQIVTSPTQAARDANVLVDASDGGHDAGSDANLPDAFMVPDAFALDAFVVDASMPDANVPDAFRAPDAFMPDAFMPDAFMPDASQPDGGVDAGGPAPGSVNLRSAATYVVLAGSTVTNTGFSLLMGDIGITPGSGLIGFPPGIDIGTIHIADAMAAQAMLDLTTAYNDAAGRTLAPITVAGNLGGQTLAAGLYKSTSGLAVSAGDLTLDGGGNTNAVWIFQMASTFVMTSGRQVLLTNGARATNVFWQVGTSATIGPGAHLAGTMLADQSIALQTGASLDGRALTRIGAVTLDTNAVTLPAP